MALQAFLFKDDKALNACAVRDADHITPGSVGPQVGKLQEALMFLDGLAIENSELAAKRYGPSAASAVLSYKRRRKIINPAYQTQADNIGDHDDCVARSRAACAGEQGPAEPQVPSM